jgi:hypothetical protein
MAAASKTHNGECTCKKCTAKVICPACKETWERKEVNDEGFCDACERAHTRLQEEVEAGLYR